jgi:hypothetical protein
MTKLAIGVTIDPASSGPEKARFIYVYDPNVASPPYLDNDKGDITLPVGKVAVTIQYRLVQSEVTLANNKTYALSLPSGALQVKGPVTGTWPQQFSHPAQSGEPGKPPSMVVVIDRNDDTGLYKYSLGIVFTPRDGTATTKVDDPKIKNGGDIRGPGGLWSPRQILVTVLAFLLGFVIGWFVRNAWPTNLMTRSPHASSVLAGDCEDASAKAKPLHIEVAVSAKNVWPTDGAWFTYSYLKSATPIEKKYLDDAGGNITLPEDSTPVRIWFHLKPERVMLGNTTYALSFATGALPKDVLHIHEENSPGSWPGTFEEPVIAQGGQNISVLACNPDKKNHDYTLAIKATSQNGISTVLRHDPKIRNGGGQKLKATSNHAEPNLPVARSG